MRAILSVHKTCRSWSRSRWLCGVLLAPMGVALQVADPDSLVTPDEEIRFTDARSTSFSFAGGGGTYFREAYLTLGYSDCGGPISVPITGKSEFKEVGVAVDHQATNRFHFGARGGYVWTNNTLVGGYDTTLTDLSEAKNFLHVDPYVAVEWKYFGLGVGGVFSGGKLPSGGTEDLPITDSGDAQLSGHIRVGSLSSVYANASVWEGVPLLTSGTVNLGVGVRPVRPLELYAGHAAEGPYQGENWMGRITVDTTPNWSFYLNLRFPQDWNNYGDEFGTSIGATYRVIH